MSESAVPCHWPWTWDDYRIVDDLPSADDGFLHVVSMPLRGHADLVRGTEPRAALAGTRAAR